MIVPGFTTSPTFRGSQTPLPVVKRAWPDIRTTRALPWIAVWAFADRTAAVSTAAAVKPERMILRGFIYMLWLNLSTQFYGPEQGCQRVNPRQALSGADEGGAPL